MSEPTAGPGPSSDPVDVAPGARVRAPRTAVVTGAGRGIGAQLAIGLARHGYDVALLARTRDHLESVARRIAELPQSPRAVVVPVELTDPASVREATDRVRRELGGVGLLVNNAGVIEQAEAPFADDDVADTWRVIETNVRGPLLVTHALLPGMLAQGGGRVVNINSGAGYKGARANTGYGISKGAVARFTTMLDTQYRDRGLRVFDLAPGVVATDMTAAMPMHEGRTEWTPVEASLEIVLAIGTGQLDALSGRFLRAGEDTPDELAARTHEIVAADARRLRLVSYGPTDPLQP